MMKTIRTHSPASLMTRGIARAKTVPYRMRPYGRTMRGPMDTVKSYLPMIALFAGGMLVGYFARKPIGKLVNKVT